MADIASGWNVALVHDPFPLNLCLQDIGMWLEKLMCICTKIITLGAHAQRGYGSCVLCVCLSVCYSTSHFSNVCSSHKRYDLLNGQRRSEISNGFL